MEELRAKLAALEAARAAEAERLLSLRQAIETSDGVPDEDASVQDVWGMMVASQRSQG